MRCVAAPRCRASAHAGAGRSSRPTAASAAQPQPQRVESRDSASATLPGRRQALLSAVALSLCAGSAAPRAALAEDDARVLTFAAIPGERWNAIDATLSLPAGWSRRAGSRPKTGKEVLYTDTYGPSYKYTTQAARLTNADGGYACESVALQVQGRTGTESIADIGPLSGVDPARAFELTQLIDDVVLAETVSGAVRKDAAGQTYYEWELKTPAGNHVLLTAAATGGGLLVLAVNADGEQWASNQAGLKALQASFTLAPSAETTLDASQRIYAVRKAGGFK